jgi:hypothetical protein
VEQDHDRLLGSARNDDVIRRNDFLVAFLGVTNDGLLKRRNPIRGSISNLTRMQNGGAVDDRVDGRLALGLAATEVNHRFALFAQERGGLVKFQSHRFLDVSSELTEAHRFGFL